MASLAKRPAPAILGEGRSLDENADGRSRVQADEGLVFLDVRRLTLHPRVRLLPWRSKDSAAFAALKQSIAEHGLFEPLVVDEKNRLIHGRDRLRAVQSLGWPRVPCVRVSSEKAAAILMEANLNGSQYNKSQRALLVAAQFRESLVDRQARHLRNLAQAKRLKSNHSTMNGAATLEPMAERFGIGRDYLIAGAALWEKREGGAAEWIQRVMDGKMNLVAAYAGFLGKKKQQPSAYEFLRGSLSKTRGDLVRLKEITDEDERMKIRAAVLRLLDETDQMLTAKRTGARATVWPGLHAGGLKG